MYTVNPRISPPGGLFILDNFGRGLIRGGGLLREGGYKIIVDIKKTLLKYLVYFSRSFFMSILLITTKSMNLLW